MRSGTTADLSRSGARGLECPECTAGVDDVAFPPDSPARDAWERLHAAYHAARHDSDRLRIELAQAGIGLASFESLFRISPFSIMEQDYSKVEAWMKELRAEGVTTIDERLPNIDAVREVAPMIWIVSANPAAVRAVGLPIEELIGPIDPKICNDESYPSWISQFRAVWNREPEARAAFIASTADGRTYDAESTLAAPIVDGKPDFSRAMFTVVDVTEHRSEERRMEELIQTKNKFLASISHEIKTPLTAIVGFSQMLEDDEDMSDEDRMLMVSSIGEQAREVTDLVNDLLVAARTEAGEVKVETQAIDLAAQVDQTLTAGGTYTTGVEFHRPTDPVVATADPARVRQILRNLLTNAERYGGPQVSASIVSVDGWACVDITDDGAGVPEAEWEAIFELYRRVRNESRGIEGAGIGLAVSRQLAELMGGSLTYFRDGEHSVFRLKLPAV
jgi:signal transduction histidine kinase